MNTLKLYAVINGYKWRSMWNLYELTRHEDGAWELTSNSFAGEGSSSSEWFDTYLDLVNFLYRLGFNLELNSHR